MFHQRKKTMRRLLLVLAVAALAGAAAPTPAPAQMTESRLPIYYAIHGGLFYPARENFRALYRSSSDLAWGAGVAFPITDDYFYLVTDIAWFSAESNLGAADSVGRLEERFIHLGLLQKVFFSQRDAFRVQAGVNSIRVRESVRGPASAERSIELPRKYGYFAGIGLEHIPGGGGVAFYGDLLYEYRHSLEPELPGDVGGLRMELGINVNFN
jgi:hypothetical protein